MVIVENGDSITKATNLWVGVGCDIDNSIITILGFWNDISRDEAMEITKERIDEHAKGHEYTVFDWLDPIGSYPKLSLFFNSCGLDKLDEVHAINEVLRTVVALADKNPEESCKRNGIEVIHTT